MFPFFLPFFFTYSNQVQATPNFNQMNKKKGINTMINPIQTVKDNTDKKIVVSVIVASLLTSALVFVAVKTGIKPLAAVAKAAK